MIGNIDNNSNNIALNSKLIQQDSLNSILGSNTTKKGAENSVDSNFLIDSSDISNNAMKMYQREQDISNFTKLAMSDEENTSHNKLVEQLFSKGIVDVFEDSTITALSSNKSLMNDLGL